MLGNGDADPSPHPTRRRHAVRDARCAPPRPRRRLGGSAAGRRGQPARAATSRRWPTTRAWSTSPSGSRPRRPTCRCCSRSPARSTRRRPRCTSHWSRRRATTTPGRSTWPGSPTGSCPTRCSWRTSDTQAAIDTDSFLPVQSCMNAAKYSTSDYLPRPLAYWKVNGVQWALPFAVSAPDRVLQPERLHEGGPQPGRPPGHACRSWWPTPRRSRPPAAAWASSWTPGTSRPGWPRPTSSSSTTSNGRSRPRHQGRVQHQDRGVHLQPAEHLVRSGDAATNPSTGPDAYDNLLGIGQRQVRHDDRDVGRPGRGDPAPRRAGSTPT